MSNRIVFICGSPGAGKTTIIESIAKNKDYKILNVGSLMMKSALKKHYVKSRDDIRFLSRDRINELQIQTFKDISKMNGNIILDTHATVEQRGRYVPGFSIEHTKHLNKLVAFIYIDSLTQDISRRRKGDKTRRRENEKLEMIDVQRLINVSILSTCATELNLPLYVVFNEQGELNFSILELKAHLKDIFGV
jgi:adenylate kinase